MFLVLCLILVFKCCDEIVRFVKKCLTNKKKYFGNKSKHIEPKNVCKGV